jgi:hypothetical protein
MAFEVLRDDAREPSRYTVDAGDKRAVLDAIAKAKARCEWVSRERVAMNAPVNGGQPAGAAQHGTLGTFAGVLMPSILTILGIVLFLRLGYVVGGSGAGRVALADKRLPTGAGGACSGSRHG